MSALPGDKGLLFVVHREGETYDRIDLLAGGEREAIVFMEGEQLNSPQWSPSGHILFVREPTNPGIWAVPFSLSRLEVTGDPFLAIPDAGLPSVSRTGTMVMAQGNFSEANQLALRVRGEDTDVFLVDVVRETQTRLTFSDGAEGWPLWTRDERWIYYQRSEDFPDVVMWRTAADGSGEPEEIGPGGWYCLSPDERFLLFSLHGEGNDWDLWYHELGDDGMPAGAASGRSRPAAGTGRGGRPTVRSSTTRRAPT